LTITAQEADLLQLPLVKQHLYVDITEDDVLIQSYIDSSIFAVQDYILAPIFETTYTNTVDELTDIDNVYTLRIPHKPIKVTVTYPTEPNKVIYYDEMDYDNGTGILTITDELGFEKALTIVANIPSLLNKTQQSRMLLIGTWYAYRENDIDTNSTTVAELPTGVKFMLDSIRKSVL